jgi:hypothetical protein
MAPSLRPFLVSGRGSANHGAGRGRGKEGKEHGWKGTTAKANRGQVARPNPAASRSLEAKWGLRLTIIPLLSPPPPARSQQLREKGRAVQVRVLVLLPTSGRGGWAGAGLRDRPESRALPGPFHTRVCTPKQSLPRGPWRIDGRARQGGCGGVCLYIAGILLCGRALEF